MPAEVLSSCETKSVVLQDLYGQLNIPTLLCVCCMNKSIYRFSGLTPPPLR